MEEILVEGEFHFSKLLKARCTLSPLSIRLTIQNIAYTKILSVIRLNKLNPLVNNISIGLPAELNARTQQYEYCRAKLLTFKQLS